MFNPARQDRWVFGSRQSGFYLRKFAWTPIVRHRMVAGGASVDDPDLAAYWAQRRRRSSPPLGVTGPLLRAQHGRCPICRGLLLDADHDPQSPQEWEQWLRATRLATRKRALVAWGAGTPDERVATRLIHTHCQRRILDGGSRTRLQPTRTPQGLA
jgi:RNA-directed DNA polymerase